MNHPNKFHTGLASRVRALLERNRPLSCREIALALGESYHAVRKAIQQSWGHAGAIVEHHKDGRETYYCLGRDLKRERREASIEFAGYITIGRGSRWGAGLA